ncbi:MotA/TolQ/ExbB proton channel family protein [Puniceicoccaceae bacterium K14]|nr:MotA/TolQ/ExbB proton channel family protein [Puniceicoccaceae bacterium K14]
MRKLIGMIAILAICGSAANGQNFEQAVSEHESRLGLAIQRLNTLRDEIADKQIPLAQRLSETREETKKLRGEFEKQRAAQDSKHLQLGDLEKRLNAKRKEVDYISRTLMGEYFANYEAELSSGEQVIFGEAVRGFNLLQEDADVSELETVEKSLAIVSESLDRINTVLGGKMYDGEALDSNGVLVSGKFIQAGPLLYFSDLANQDAGLVDEGLSLQPRLKRLDKNSESLIAAFARGESNTLPVDPSLENAVLLQQTKEGFFEHLKKGGVWVYPIMFFAILSTLVAAYKFVQIFAIRQPDPLVAHQLSRLLRAAEKGKAMTLANEQPQPAKDMLVNAVEHSDEPVELVEEVMYESMLSVQPKLERFLNVIAVTAATAPLLGLLGTVTGIIKTFKLMNVFGAGDPKPLISGISEALITTELGLVLAIPALIVHALLSRKVAGVLARMEKLSVALTNSMSRRTPGGSSDV